MVYEIELEDPTQRPIKQHTYNHSRDDLEFLKREVDTLLDADLVEETTSPWAQPCVIAKRNM